MTNSLFVPSYHRTWGPLHSGSSIFLYHVPTLCEEVESVFLQPNPIQCLVHDRWPGHPPIGGHPGYPQHLTTHVFGTLSSSPRHRMRQRLRGLRNLVWTPFHCLNTYCLTLWATHLSSSSKRLLLVVILECPHQPRRCAEPIHNNIQASLIVSICFFLFLLLHFCRML